MKIFAVPFALATLCASSAVADNFAGAFLSGNQLHDYCRTNKQAAIYYIVGLTDGILYWNRIVKTSNLCLPVNVNSEQLTDLVCRAIDADPVGRSNPASGITAMALMSAWPCR